MQNVKSVQWVFVGDINPSHGGIRLTYATCDPSDCLGCSFVSSSTAELGFSYQNCFEKGNTYLLLSQDDDLSWSSSPTQLSLTSPPMPLSVEQWQVFSSICSFSIEKQLVKYRIDRPTNCPALDEGQADNHCYDDNEWTVNLLKNETVDMSNKQCLQKASSFQQRLAFAGAATIVPVGSLKIESQSEFYTRLSFDNFCDDSNCVGLCNQGSLTNCSLTYGSVGSLNCFKVQFLLQNVSNDNIKKNDSNCNQYYYDSSTWGDCQQFANGQGKESDAFFYLLFHSPLSQCGSQQQLQTAWLLGEPVQFSQYDDLWKQLSSHCYFTGPECSELCQNGDFQLPLACPNGPTTPTTTTTTSTTTPQTTTTPKVPDHLICQWDNDDNDDDDEDGKCVGTSDCIDQRVSLAEYGNDVFFQPKLFLFAII